MNIKNFTRAVEVGRGTVGHQAPTTARAANDRPVVDVYQYGPGALESGRAAAAGKRPGEIARLDAQVREGRYTPDREQLAQEILAEADTASRLSAMLRA